MIRLIAFVCVACVMSSCATNKRTALSHEELGKIQKLQVQHVMVQDEIRVNTRRIDMSGANGAAASGAAGALGGALGALIVGAIESSRNKKDAQVAYERAIPLLNAVDDFNIRKVAADQINASIKKSFSSVEAVPAAVPKALTSQDLKQKIKSLAEGEYLLVTSVFYEFRQGSQNIEISSAASLYKNKQTNEKADKPKPVYSGTFKYISKNVGFGYDTSMQEWSKDGASAYKASIQEGLTAIADLLNYDLQKDQLESCENLVEFSAFNYLGTPQKLKGILIEQKTDRAVVRSLDFNTLYSVAGTPNTKVHGGNNCQ